MPLWHNFCSAFDKIKHWHMLCLWYSE